MNSVTVNAQLLAPRKPTKVNVLLEVGGAAEMMAENSTHAFITGTSTLQLGKILILRGIVTQGTKSRFQNLKSQISNNQFVEFHFSPLGKYWGFYGAYDHGVRNYKFENLIQNDVETGASSKQPDPVQYSPEENTGNAVLQYALPSYRFGFGWYLGGAETSEGAAVNFQFSLFGCHSPKASNLNNVLSTLNSYNVNVPVMYEGASNLKASSSGFGALFLLQSKYLGGRMEVGKRPTLYQNDQYVTGAAKGLYFLLGLNLRLL
ncbi:MAG: hypothetical protein JNL57_13560 [Bacteroidetes bacterium]|nr:hypothetical protein [Bacteroidota bacterium]